MQENNDQTYVNMIKAKAEVIISEEQVGFRKDIITIEYILI